MKRRQLLSRIGGAGIIVGAAGCIGGDDDNGNDDENGDDGNGVDNGDDNENGDDGNGVDNGDDDTGVDNEDLEILDKDEATQRGAFDEMGLSYTDVNRTGFEFGDARVIYDPDSVVFSGDMFAEDASSTGIRTHLTDEGVHLQVDGTRYEPNFGEINIDVQDATEEEGYSLNAPFWFEGLPESTLGADDALLVFEYDDGPVAWDVTDEFDVGPFPEVEVTSIEFEEFDAHGIPTLATVEFENTNQNAGTIRVVFADDREDDSVGSYVEKDVSGSETIIIERGLRTELEDAWLEVRTGFETVSEEASTQD